MIADGGQDAPLLKVNTLGWFSVELNGENLSEDSRRQQQIWTLFKYILNARKRRIPPEEFYDVLWRDETVDNPAKALQNLIYRLRRVLSRDQKDAPKYILLKQGCYCWNPEAPAEIDVELFERYQAKSVERERAGDADGAIDACKECISLYKGDYLSESSSFEWVIPVANHYKRQFINTTARATRVLSVQKRYDEILSICESAFQIEPYEEQLHAAFIEALIALGNPKQARAHYEFITSSLYREFGVKPSQTLKDAYRAINDNFAGSHMDIDILQELLSEKDQTLEAYQCEPELFKNIYKLEARRAVRNGQVVFLVLMTIVYANQATPEPQTLSPAMEKLNKLLLSSLRRGDVISRWNESQFVIMLASLTYEDGEMVVRRIAETFENSYSNGKIKLRHKVQQLNPIF